MKKTFKRLLTAIGTVIALSTTAMTAFAEGSADANVSQAGTQSPSATSSLLYYGGMIAIFLVAGNRISSIGGIVGTVEKVTDEDIYLTNGLVLKRWALRTIDETAPEGGSAAVTYYDEDEESDK